MEGGPVHEAGRRYLKYEHFGAAVGLWSDARGRALDAAVADRIATWESSWADVMADLADDGTSVFANGGHAVGAFQGLDCPHSQGGERMICVMPDV